MATQTEGLPSHHIETIKATIPALQEHGVAITTVFYDRLFEKHPELRNIFNVTHQASGEQPRALAHAVLAYASNIENPQVLSKVIYRIGNKHTSLGVMPEHYPVVGQGLLSAIKEVLGEAATEPVIDAWAAAYQQLAGFFTNVEADLYRAAAETPGGWEGWRKFVLSDKVRESQEITSFHLTPVDKGPLPTFKPGQFVSVRCFVPELGVYQPRQYSLSDIPNQDRFRISVKKEAPAGVDLPAGHVSSFLHDSLPVGSELDISMPFGDFVLNANATTPVVLISGGVGLTPMVAMMKAVVAENTSRKVVFVHGVRNGGVQAMKETLSHAVSSNPQNVSRAVFYGSVSEADRPGLDYDFAGPVDLNRIKDKVLLPGADYYICGPLPFMGIQREALLAMGVEPERIHMEVFGSPAE